MSKFLLEGSIIFVALLVAVFILTVFFVFICHFADWLNDKIEKRFKKK